jgi:hypothetical protein
LKPEAGKQQLRARSWKIKRSSEPKQWKKIRVQSCRRINDRGWDGSVDETERRALNPPGQRQGIDGHFWAAILDFDSFDRHAIGE